MELELENVPSDQASAELAKRGVPAGTPVTIIIGDDIPSLAARMRAYAQSQGMTPELFDELMKDDS